MPKYLLALRAPESYEPSPSSTPAWTNWFQRLEPNVLDLGHPVIERTTVGSCATGTVLRGYSLITTDNSETALLLARECPLVDAGGGVEVGLLGPGPRQNGVSSTND